MILEKREVLKVSFKTTGFLPTGTFQTITWESDLNYSILPAGRKDRNWGVGLLILLSPLQSLNMKLYIFRARLCKAWQRTVTGDSTLNGDRVGQIVLEDVHILSEMMKRPCM